MEDLNHYELLGVESSSSVNEISKAFRRRMKEYHPDRINDMGRELRELAEVISKRIIEAYDVLKDPDRRKEYDIENGFTPVIEDLDFEMDLEDDGIVLVKKDEFEEEFIITDEDSEEEVDFVISDPNWCSQCGSELKRSEFDNRNYWCETCNDFVSIMRDEGQGSLDRGFSDHDHVPGMDISKDPGYDPHRRSLENMMLEEWKKCPICGMMMYMDETICWNCDERRRYGN